MTTIMKQNTLFEKALKKENIDRPPVWLMRQAGRYMPEYQSLAKKYNFFTRVYTPELAAQITLQPINSFKPDAAILFSDILVIPQALGMEVNLVENIGPVLPNTIKNIDDINKLNNQNNIDSLKNIFDAIKIVKNELDKDTSLIGFAGAPFTLLCYMVEGRGSKTFDKAKRFCFEQPEIAKLLLDKITDITIHYLKQKINSGVDVIQIFDSWSGLLSAEDFKKFSWPYLERIANELHNYVPVIFFPKGSWYALEYINTSKASAIGIDWNISAEMARKLTNNDVVLQGNFDPTKLFLSPQKLEEEVVMMIDKFGIKNYIANLGHGILPNTPVENVKLFVETVKNYKEKSK